MSHTKQGTRAPLPWQTPCQNAINYSRTYLYACTIGLAFSTTPVHAANIPYAEFVKALNIVEQTQLTLFVESETSSKKQILADYRTKVATAKAELNTQDANFEDALEQKRLDIMRELLDSTIDQYNDQYANYIYPDALKRYNSRRNGKFVGVGLKFRTIKGDYPVAIGALSGGPMHGLDIRPGDKLISVNNFPLNNLTSSDVVKALKGPENSIANLVVSRDDRQHQLAVKRAAVELHYAVAEMLEHNIGYLKISRFGSKTHIRVRALVSELIKQGASSFILDLRDNPGGSTRAARSIASIFSEAKHVYCERYESGKVKLLPRHGDHLTDLPLAVLINEESMSSSEIVAGAIKSAKRGVLIGSQSFGKGLVQKVFNLAPPLGGAIRTTIAAFGTPDHQIIHKTGIAPDIIVETDHGFMFRRTGSLNIAADARRFQRKLLEQDVMKQYPEKANEFIVAKDLQLQTAINTLEQTINNTQ